MSHLNGFQVNAQNYAVLHQNVSSLYVASNVSASHRDTGFTVSQLTPGTNSGRIVGKITGVWKECYNSSSGTLAILPTIFRLEDNQKNNVRVCDFNSNHEKTALNLFGQRVSVRNFQVKEMEPQFRQANQPSVEIIVDRASTIDVETSSNLTDRQASVSDPNSVNLKRLRE